MRAGPLSRPEIITRLNRDFVNCWILRKDLMALAKKAEGETGKFAARALKHYDYPVDNLVFSSAGKFLANLPANSAGSTRPSKFRALLDATKPK